MRAFTAREEKRVLDRARSGECILMSDFDGVLSPIVRDPYRARISKRARASLIACAKKFPVVVISGRALADVRARVGIPGIWYAGNHGLEWHFGADRGHASINAASIRALKDAKRAFVSLSRRYPGVIVEDKRRSISVHFRGLSRTHTTTFRREVKALAPVFRVRGIVIEEGQEHVFNVRPKKGFNKGSAALHALKRLPKKSLPIFIGDDTTDEDAFRALRKGVTIRVGKKAGSAARYFVSDRRAAERFLAHLADAAR